jgi:DNA-binding PadR family transcriptional regulator
VGDAKSDNETIERLVLDILSKASDSTFAFICIEVNRRLKGDHYHSTYRALKSLRKRGLVRYGWGDGRWYPIRKRAEG